ncbi:MAG: phosphopantetheine-binding protein [Aestuariivita sp.]|nr:phosphopantetheine-binding protein [Aestuariivita sp.]
MTVEDRLINLIAEQAMLDTSDVTRDSTFDALGIDSVGVIECIFAIEEEFDISIPFDPSTDNTAFDLSNLASIADEIEKLLAR